MNTEILTLLSMRSVHSIFASMRRKNDILLKSAFEEAFPDLLCFFFPRADTLFDMARGFEFMDKELSELFPELEKQGGSRFVDMLVKAWLQKKTIIGQPVYGC